MRKIAEKWLKQAVADLAAARDSLESGHFEWCCFQAQQCGEKALKACLYEQGYTSVVTHSLKELLRECAKLAPSFGGVAADARTLDAYYIPTRYPNGLGGDLPPAEYYEREDAERCLVSAESILNVAKPFLGS